MTMRNAFEDLATEETVGSLLRRAIALLMSPRVRQGASPAAGNSRD